MSRKKPAVRAFETVFVVEGRGEFPIDMLRYDCAFTATQHDSDIAQYRDHLRRVVLVSRRVNDSDPTAERWRSFGWTVVNVFPTIGDAARFVGNFAAVAPGGV